MDWNKVKSAVAGVDGLDVTFEDESGQLGAVRMPYASQQYPVRQPGPNAPFDVRGAVPCTDASLKTYRTIGVFPDGKYSSALFKACSDQDAWSIAVPAWQQNKNLGFCLLLERLDAKPGYVSAWTLVKQSNDCNQQNSQFG